MKRDLGAHPQQLSRLLDGVANGTVLLPEFQRSFDWSQGNVRSLLATILMDWPAGSLLLMDGKPQFALRPLEGAPSRGTEVSYVVLDGQQRLTALFHALRGFGEQVWILESQKMPSELSEVSVDDLEDAISAVDREEWRSEYPIERQAHEGLIPLETLASATDYFDWRDAAVETVEEGRRKEVRSHLTEIYKSLLSRVHDYSFPTVVLQAQLEVEAIARIFERINRTGLRLTTFDLMVARTYSSSWNLRDEWEGALSDLPILGDFLEDGLPALQVVSLLEQGDIRQPAVLQSEPAEVQSKFRVACEALAVSFEWLATTCGLRRPEWMPYAVMPVVLAALQVENALEERSADLERWFWLGVLSQRFDVASSTQAATDFTALRKGGNVSFASLRDGTFTVAANPLLEATRRRMGPFWRGFACAMGTGILLDPLSGESLVGTDTEALIPRSSVRSIFPKGAAIPGRTPAHLLVLSTFVASAASSRALAGQPAAWSEVDMNNAALESQLLPPSRDIGAMLFDSSAFVADRLDRLRRFAEDRSGVTIVTV